MKLIDLIVKEVKREDIHPDAHYFAQTTDGVLIEAKGLNWEMFCGDDVWGIPAELIISSKKINCVASDSPKKFITRSHLMNAYDEIEKKDNELVEPEKLVDDNSFGESARYNRGGIECIEIMKAMTADKSGIEAICVSNVTKYLYRYKDKNGLVDVIKARNYLNKLIEEMESGKL